MTAKELMRTLNLHARWLSGDGRGRLAYLRGAYLRGADLREADLREADLIGANLRGADLRGANLIGAYLRGAKLREADLIGAKLREADLSGADLRWAKLIGADLSGADLIGADLVGADLSVADLRGADLVGADLREADLRGAKNAQMVWAKTLIVPEGAIIGWKKCRDGYIVKLRIPEKARRSNATGRKCRAEYAKVLAIFTPDGGEAQEARSVRDESFIYRVGSIARAAEWCDDRWQECAGGIHFYLTREEAEARV